MKTLDCEYFIFCRCDSEMNEDQKVPSNDIDAIRTKLENGTISDDSYDEQSDSDNFEWSGEENGSRELKSNKTHMNPQEQSSKSLTYQSIDKLFSKYSGKINIGKYECSNLDGEDK